VAELCKAITVAYRAEKNAQQVTKIAKTIKKFVDLRPGDIALICRGYAPNQKDKPVHIYGFARITSGFRVVSSDWEWRFRHDAVIQEVNVPLSKDVVVAALGGAGKGSLIGTLHDLDRARFEAIVRELGVRLEV
jgi:hypothetical protein